MEITDKLELAARFINNTGSHVFLTGKAGTGKTTFLRELAEKTHKSYLIVAPTGIAALNAGGVTIHSQFLFPFGAFVPEQESAAAISRQIPLFTKHSLTRMHPLNSMRKKVLRATELLIIDEVSMLRADILDAIDHRMKRARGDHSRSFGGAQLLLIGDLHQLPPIVREEEWEILGRYYRSIHFFEAQALRDSGMVYLELDKIFRQQDQHFISILNHLRDNVASEEDIRVLNERYNPGETDPDAIIITTHNRTADEINQRRLAGLPAPAVHFEAELKDDFPDKLHPLPLEIELKEGAQLMFVRNDSSDEKAYVNGSLARVLSIEDDEITVLLRDSGKEFVLKQEEWYHKKYVLDEEENAVVEEVMGSFRHYPVKLAWAVTVHKSQGLTFEKAVIDVGQAFAPGQVYVALSRLRSLEGLSLRTRIHPSVIMNDLSVDSFTRRMENQKSAAELLEERKRQYLEGILLEAFDFSDIMWQLENLRKFRSEKMEFADEEMKRAMGRLEQAVASERKNTLSFRKQLQMLLHEGSIKLLMERLDKGRAYYTDFMEEQLGHLLIHIAEVERLTRTKTYRNALEEIEQLMVLALGRMERVSYVAHCILEGQIIEKDRFREHVRRRNLLWESAREAAENNPKFAGLKSGRKRKKGVKVEKGETYRLTWSLVLEGKTVEEIAEERRLKDSTIETHIVKGIEQGEIDISAVLSQERIGEIAEVLRTPHSGIASAYHAGDRKYSHGELRMVAAYLKLQRQAQDSAG